MEQTPLIVLILTVSLFISYALLHLTSKITSLEAKTSRLSEHTTRLQQYNNINDKEILEANGKLEKLENKMNTNQEFVGTQLVEIQNSLKAPLMPVEGNTWTALQIPSCEEVEVLNTTVFRLNEQLEKQEKRVRELGNESTAALSLLREEIQRLTVSTREELIVASSNFEIIDREMKEQTKALAILRGVIDETNEKLVPLNQTLTECVYDIGSLGDREDQLSLLINTTRQELTQVAQDHAKTHQTLLKTNQDLGQLTDKVGKSFDKATEYFVKTNKAVQEAEANLRKEQSNLAKKIDFVREQLNYHIPILAQRIDGTQAVQESLRESVDQCAANISGVTQKADALHVSQRDTTRDLIDLRNQVSTYESEDKEFENKLERLIGTMTTGQQVSLGAVESLQKEVSGLKQELEEVASKAVEKKLSPQVMDVLKRIQALQG